VLDTEALEALEHRGDVVPDFVVEQNDASGLIVDGDKGAKLGSCGYARGGFVERVGRAFGNRVGDVFG
jgi:hypothetical protein